MKTTEMGKRIGKFHLGQVSPARGQAKIHRAHYVSPLLRQAGLQSDPYHPSRQGTERQHVRRKNLLVLATLLRASDSSSEAPQRSGS